MSSYVFSPLHKSVNLYCALQSKEEMASFLHIPHFTWWHWWSLVVFFVSRKLLWRLRYFITKFLEVGNSVQVAALLLVTAPPMLPVKACCLVVSSVDPEICKACRLFHLNVWTLYTLLYLSLMLNLKKQYLNPCSRDVTGSPHFHHPGSKRTCVNQVQ